MQRTGTHCLQIASSDLLFVQNTSPVEVAHKLDLAPYCSAAVQGPLYQLAAVTNHSGSMGGGHYVAERRSSDDRWYTCNDSSVVQQRAAGGPSEEAYMLFYRRQDW